MDSGIEEYRRVPALNCDPTFIRSLHEIVETAVAWSEVATES